MVDLDRVSLPANARLTERAEPGLLGGVVVLAGEGKMQPEANWQDQLYRPVAPVKTSSVAFKAIPYCVWGESRPAANESLDRRGCDLVTVQRRSRPN
ncbi:MAG TPA: hypothetical protein VG206_18600 [Terriglobia bacterium]|nr:hypothetical protein [Terriglobia bacterium]